MHIDLIVIYFFNLDDVFGIDEVTIYDGEHAESTYAVAGDVLDGVNILNNLNSSKRIANNIIYINFSICTTS